MQGTLKQALFYGAEGMEGLGGDSQEDVWAGWSRSSQGFNCFRSLD